MPDDDGPLDSPHPDDHQVASPEDRPGSSHSSVGAAADSPSSPPDAPRRRLTGPFYLANILNEENGQFEDPEAVSPTSKGKAPESATPPPRHIASLSPISPAPVAGPSRHPDDPVHHVHHYEHPPHDPSTHYAYSYPPPPPLIPGAHPMPTHTVVYYPRSRAEADADYLRRQLCLAPTVAVDLYAIADPPDGQKPFASLPTLIKLAIHGSPKKKLTLQGICEALVKRFAWFHEHQMDDAWKNSVRHNLSLNKVFRKVPRDAKQMGKGCYWELDLSGGEGHKRPRKRRKHDKATGTMVSAIQSTRASTNMPIMYGATRFVTAPPPPGSSLLRAAAAVAAAEATASSSNDSTNGAGRLVSTHRGHSPSVGRLVVPPRLRPVKSEDGDVDMEEDDEEDEDEEIDQLADDGDNEQMDVDPEEEEEDDDDDVESEEATDRDPMYRPRVRAPPATPAGGGRNMRPRHGRTQSDTTTARSADDSDSRLSPSTPTRGRGARQATTPVRRGAGAGNRGVGRLISPYSPPNPPTPSGDPDYDYDIDSGRPSPFPNTTKREPSTD
ncbi:Fork-head domain-containing protein [Mycena kentingensis (nom. inval.)]|nr:Fork-head domain-containing protein [Mycena kentingensis (nom. inval.)]